MLAFDEILSSFSERVSVLAADSSKNALVTIGAATVGLSIVGITFVLRSKSRKDGTSVEELSVLVKDLRASEAHFQQETSKLENEVTLLRRQSQADLSSKETELIRLREEVSALELVVHSRERALKVLIPPFLVLQTLLSLVDRRKAVNGQREQQALALEEAAGDTENVNEDEKNSASEVVSSIRRYVTIDKLTSDVLAKDSMEL